MILEHFRLCRGTMPHARMKQTTHARAQYIVPYCASIDQPQADAPRHCLLACACHRCNHKLMYEKLLSKGGEGDRTFYPLNPELL